MQETLKKSPERFGLFNNGITIVVSDFRPTGSGSYELVEPFVVNGCQTTRTIWEVCNTLLNAGGSGVNPAVEAWRERAERGCVVAKVAKVGHDGEALLQDITRYTNSQNAVRDKDFIALHSGFKAWKSTLGTRYGVYLEVQRGGWDSQRAFQKQNPASNQFSKHANALDLVKVYGSGWLGQPGVAFGKNPPILPGGSIFQRLGQTPAGTRPFGAEDLYAAYLLLKAGEAKEFGRGGPPARRQTKFLFYFVTIYLLRSVLQGSNRPSSNPDLSDALIKLLSQRTAAGDALISNAVSLIDTYMTKEDGNSFAHEPLFTGEHNFDLSAFLKSDHLGRDLAETPKLQQVLYFSRQFMRQKPPTPGSELAESMIIAAL